MNTYAHFGSYLPLLVSNFITSIRFHNFHYSVRFNPSGQSNVLIWKTRIVLKKKY